MPQLIDDLPPAELEWTKLEDGSYLHVEAKEGVKYHIVPSGGKFALEVTEPSAGKGRKGKVGKTIQACKGPLKVCKGFALDIVEGSLVKMESGNWGAPQVETPAPIKPSPLTPPVAPIEAVPLTPPVEPIQPEPLTSIPTILGLSQAIALLSRQVQITQLPAGSHFSLDGKFGTFIEAIGGDAKVEVDGKTIQWSGDTAVLWAAARPKAEPKAPKVKAEPIEAPKEGKSPATSPKPQAAPKESKPRSGGIFGFSLGKILRWCAKDGISLEEARKVLQAHNVLDSIKDASIKNMYKDARIVPAVLTPDQIKQLKAIVGKK
jgi:hypothetical protein